MDDGSDAVSEWHDSATAGARAGLAARMVHLRQQQREGWIRPYYDILKDGDGVGSVRWKVQRVQHRAFGYFGPARNEFTFLGFTTKTDGYDETDIKHAKDRRKLVEKTPSLSIFVAGRWGQ